MNDITSSVVVAKAMGLKLEGEASPVACSCTYCGLPIKKGDPSGLFAVGNTFMDKLSLASPGSPRICGYCTQLTKKEFLYPARKGWAYSYSGRHEFSKWKDIHQVLKNPPEAPFVLTYATAKNQHMAWRSPVNWSQDFFRVRVGLRIVSIRRKVMDEAVDACRVIGIERKASESLPNPFSVLSPDLKDGRHGQLHSKFFSSEFREQSSPEEKSALNTVLNLSLGELWALRFYLSPSAGE